jgi:hypothetical protein
MRLEQKALILASACLLAQIPLLRNVSVNSAPCLPTNDTTLMNPHGIPGDGTVLNIFGQSIGTNGVNEDLSQAAGRTYLANSKCESGYNMPIPKDSLAVRIRNWLP